MDLVIKSRQVFLTIIFIAALSVQVSDAFAVGIVSRACAPAFGAQESISVEWAYVPLWLFTRSVHFQYPDQVEVHDVATGWNYTWRSRAGHWGEYWPYAKVKGFHYRMINNVTIYLGSTLAKDCNLTQWGLIDRP